ncbi:MAG: methyltransferase [Candidatus Marinimicrobia bacterium]|jgi:SAM-dependent methyltransferase|nr:methyltransferase [Candidatus Neomarinimicrobiota bacterium]HBN45299.1 hypothetical protein [Candidatus Neomarinimicrobiota bacterium]HJL74023.1 class I SAM-dependent methyltransferase [Candidatus Neomarinimicrobiota bacterium]|tara:strand:+ start:13602 stop:14483 length:882 start_codon:yes stop_codon:yes gene_type:complete
MIDQTHCPLCKNELTIVFTTKDFLVSGESFDIVECSDCGLRLTSPFPNKDNIGSYYESEEYISHAEETKGLFDFIYNMVRAYMLGRKGKIIERSSRKRSGTILDIGCGAGHFLDKMKIDGWRVKGVDVSSKAREIVKQQFDIEVISPDDWLNSDEKYDVVTCWHSLEHVHDPLEYLQKFKQQLNENGILVVALPNYDSPDAHKYGADWAAYDTPRHLYHFTPPSISKIMTQNGFSVQGCHRINFDPFYVSILSAKHKGSSHFSGIVNGLASWFISVFQKEKCSSLIYIMKVNE